MESSIYLKKMYNKRAESYDTIHNKFRYSKQLKQLIKSLEINIPPTAKILDLGCGTGFITEVLIKRFPKAKIINIDISEEMLKICHKKFPDIELLLGDFNQAKSFLSFTRKKYVNLNSSSFDLIISAGALSEHGDLDRAVPLIYNLLKKNGIFINMGTNKNIGGMISGKIWHFKPVGKKKFIFICRNSGFSSIQTIPIPWKLFPINYLKYVVRAKK